MHRSSCNADPGSQSLESNGSSNGSGIGSLTSLRRRWWRAVSTSLGRSDSDDVFGMQHWNETGSDGHVKRHKTRLGLTMLVRLVQGHERYKTILCGFSIEIKKGSLRIEIKVTY